MSTAPELIERIGRVGRVGGDERRLTLAGRLRWALGGVALFVVPMAALMVWFLARVYAASQAHVAELEVATRVEAAWDPVQDALDAPDTGPAPRLAALEELDAAMVALVEDHPLHIAEVDAVRTGTRDLGQALEVLAGALGAQPVRGPSVLGQALSAVEGARIEAGAAPLRDAVLQRAAELRRAVTAARSSALAHSREAGEELHQAVDAANRNLVTLALALLVYLGYLYVFLPGRLLASFARIRATLRQGSTGDLSVRAPTEGGDDAAVLGREFNAMMEVIERFDLRKRQRIHQDAQVIRALGERLGAPFALLGLEGRIDVANAAFWGLLGRQAPPAGTRLYLTDVLSLGARELSDLIARSLEERRLVEDHPVRVQTPDGRELRFAMTAGPIRSTDARLTHMLVTLRPE